MSILRMHTTLLLLVLSLASPAGAREVIRGRVVGVADGDTITIVVTGNRRERIRLAGIDAPERRQAFSSRSKENLSKLTYGRDVDVEVTKRDRHQRLVGKVTVAGVDTCLAQIRAGLAWLYTDYEDELSPKDRDTYRDAVKNARANRIGLWADPSPMPPWQFRRSARSQPQKMDVFSQQALLTGTIIGNRRSRIYHLPDCPSWSLVSPPNRRYFATEADALAAGFRKAQNCP